MRQIGSLPGEAQARLFADILLSRGIRSELEAESNHSWAVWIRDDDHLAEAESILARFSANPNAPEFQNAIGQAAKTRKAEAEDLAKYRRRVRTGKSLFPQFRSYGVGILTFVLIAVCVYMSVYITFGHATNLQRALFISDPENTSGKMLPEVFNGEIWRLFTPIFMHADLKRNPLHLLFNMLWLFQLGSMIEARKSSLFLFGFVAVTAVFSNLAQYYFYKNPAFLGMSGVIFAMIGYIWICGKYNPASGLYLDRQSVVYSLVWLVVCFTGMVGPIANGAHLAGLLVGMAWGGIAAFIGRRNPE
jgi:GlpG protein